MKARLLHRRSGDTVPDPESHGSKGNGLWRDAGGVLKEGDLEFIKCLPSIILYKSSSLNLHSITRRTGIIIISIMWKRKLSLDEVNLPNVI